MTHPDVVAQARSAAAQTSSRFRIQDESRSHRPSGIDKRTRAQGGSGVTPSMEAVDLTKIAHSQCVPYYRPIGNEREVFLAAHTANRPVLIKGPTGCGKTRFVEAMAAEIGIKVHTVACHEDLTAADLVGRHLLQGDTTVWIDGPPRGPSARAGWRT